MVYTGFERPSLTTTVNYGWFAGISSFTTSGATVYVRPLIDFTYLKFKWVATQGDQLQVFYLEINCLGEEAAIRTVAFHYANLVEFDVTNLPSEVLLAYEAASYQFENDGLTKYFVIAPVSKIEGYWQFGFDAVPYLELYGPDSMFTDSGELTYFEQSFQRTTVQATLLIHRVNLPTETASTGLNHLMQVRTSSGEFNFDSTLASYNILSASPGKVLYGLLGFYGYYSVDLPSSTCSASLTFTDISTVTSSFTGF